MIEDTCKHCGRRIFMNRFDGRWFHYGNDGGVWRGCRAASFTKGAGWDDSLHKKKTATPVS